MAQSKTDLIKANRIRTYIGAEDAVFPTHDKLDPTSMAANAAWSSLGFTSKETPLAITTEGGEVTTLDAAEEDAIIAIADAVKRTLEIKALQFDVETMSLAYNGVYDEEALTYKVPTSSQPLVRRALVVIQKHDGSFIAVGALGGISVGEEPTLSFDALSQIGLKITVMGDSGTALHWIGVKRSTTVAG